jgi:hypothetical protein
MDRFTFLNLVSKPETLTSADVEALEMVAKSFPYCQTTYILLAKASHNSGSMLATKKIKTAAAFAANRAILKKIIHDEWESKKIIETVVENDFKEENTSPITLTDNADLEKNTESIEVVYDSVVDHSEPKSVDITIEQQSSSSNIADEIASNLLYWHEMRQKASQFWDKDSIQINDAQQELSAPENEKSNLIAGIEAEEQESNNTFVDEMISETYNEVTFPYKTTLTEVPLAYDHIEFQQSIPNEFLLATAEINTVTATNEIVESNNTTSSSENQLFIPVLVTPNDFNNIDTEIELDNHNENELLLEYLLSLKKEKKKKRVAEKDKKEIQDEIIENFIKLKPGISRVSKQEINNLQSNNKDLSLKSTIPNNNLISETLAKIMVKQNKISQAIEMYHKLILKYPEKKTYFVGIIKSLEEK